jgi:hypothetical protein
LNKRVVIILCLFVCLALVIGVYLYWNVFRWKWKKEMPLEWYIGMLEDEGYIIEERSLTEFRVDGALEVYWFSDFRSIARQENVTQMYIDQEMEALYFLGQTPGGLTEANLYHYAGD